MTSTDLCFVQRRVLDCTAHVVTNITIIMKNGLVITCKEHSVVSFMVLLMHFPGGKGRNKQIQWLLSITK